MPFFFGCLAGAVPWIVIAVSLAARTARRRFVYGIIVSLFVLFNVFAVNMVLQYRKVGRWRDYLFGGARLHRPQPGGQVGCSPGRCSAVRWPAEPDQGSGAVHRRH